MADATARPLSGFPDVAGISAIVTGGAAGQGAAHVAHLHAAGAAVVAVDRVQPPGEEAREGIVYIHGDVTAERTWQRAVEAAEALAPLTVLVNNAAVHRMRSICDETVADVSSLLSINLLGPLLGIQAAVPAMRRAGRGSIINVASIAARTGYASMAAYSASKAALVAFSRVAAVELGADGIRVNCVLPGAIDTAMMTGDRDQPGRFDHLPLGRVGHVADVVGVVMFLASDASSYLTGAEIAVDGGALAGRR